MDWREYQRAAASFFETLGMQAEVEAEVVGVRSKHTVDVAVTFTAYGIDHTWLVECKLWRRKVHKEKVVALRSIVDDVGADRGFLLSESGFDPGAVTAARLTSITLTNLEDLRANAEADIESIRWAELYAQVIRCNEIADDLQPIVGVGKHSITRLNKPGLDRDDFMFNTAHIGLIQRGLERVRRGQFPIPCSYEREPGAGSKWAKDAPTFYDAASETLDECERWLTNEAGKPWPDKPETKRP